MPRGPQQSIRNTEWGIETRVMDKKDSTAMSIGLCDHILGDVVAMIEGKVCRSIMFSSLLVRP
jgi:hypothetical protein